MDKQRDQIDRLFLPHAGDQLPRDRLRRLRVASPSGLRPIGEPRSYLWFWLPVAALLVAALLILGPTTERMWSAYFNRGAEVLGAPISSEAR